MPAPHVRKLLREHPAPLRTHALARIAADRHQVDPHRQRDRPDQVRSEDHRPGEDRDDGDLGIPGHPRRGVVHRDLRRQLADAGIDAVSVDQDALDVLLHGADGKPAAAAHNSGPAHGPGKGSAWPAAAGMDDHATCADTLHGASKRAI